MPLDLQYDIVNDTPAAAGPVEANFNRTEQYINQELIARDGHVAMTGQLRLVGNPVVDLDAAPKNYVDQVLPIGIIMMFAGPIPESGRWLVCDGAEYETAAYPELFEVIATTYTTGGSGGHFNVPDFSGRMARGTSSTVTVGSTGGSADSTGVPAHLHVMDHQHAATLTGPADTDHQHFVGDHTHSMGHTHGVGSHRHYMLPNEGTTLLRGETPTGPGTGLSLTVEVGPNAESFSTITGSTEAPASPTGPPSLADTGGIAVGPIGTSGALATHRHSFADIGFNGSTGTTGTGVTNGNLPPYIGLIFAIRAR